MKELWILGFLVNLFFLASVFDIYFKSPIVDVSVVHKGTIRSGIKRVLFFVADGLRADTFFDNPQLRPRLTELIEKNEEVVWGISDTRVPTESRPGHIALFAGFYEDPSAVFTGWKNNLVEFDSVFNRTDGAVLLGSPDVVTMFARGAAKAKIYSETYPSDWQDFLAANSTVLDTWVFDRFRSMAEKKDLPLHENLVIFLHLLGIDNTGHATKPHSPEYKNGMFVVDGIVSKVESIVKEYYKDKDTLFIFTSDHGMTDWGSHGSGSRDETETPFVIWGPGIKSGSNLRLKQADMAALIAGSLGSYFPTNSVGKFPVGVWLQDSFAYDALKTNFLQLHELMKTKKWLVGSERNFPLIEFPKESTFMDGFQKAEKLANGNAFDIAISELEKAFEDVEEGNFYYERYNQHLLIVFTVIAFLVFMSLVAIMTLSIGRVDPYMKSSRIFSLQNSLLALLLAFILTKCLIRWSLWRIGYGFVPIYLSLLVTTEVLKRKEMLGELVGGKTKLFLGLGLSAFGIEMLVLSFRERSVLSLTLILNIIWILLVHLRLRQNNQMQKGRRERSGGAAGTTRHLVYLLTGICMAVGALALFPVVPIIGNSKSPFFTTVGPLVSSGFVGLVASIKHGSSSKNVKRKSSMDQRDKVVMGLQLMLQGSVAVLVHFPTSIVTRVVSWMSLGFSLILPTLMASEDVTMRLASVFLGIGTPFAFLGISYETLFLPCLFLVLLLLLKLEVDEEEGIMAMATSIGDGDWSWNDLFSLYINGKDRREKGPKEKIDVHRAFRRAWFHLFFVFMSFFGTGNIGSLSSFDPSSTRCFVSVFNPWVMMVLMLTKIIGPFLLVSCVWRALLPSKTDVERNFGMLLLFCQGMGLHMFFRVTNQGSWLEIGTSISHFVIVQSTTLFLFLLHFLANFLVNYELLRPSIRFPVGVAVSNKKAVKGN